MRNMREQLTSMGEKLISNLGETTIKVSEKALGKCVSIFFFEPKISIELLQENKDK